MQWVLDNWIWLLLGGGMVAMHLFGHGKHGGHGKNGKEVPAAPEPASEPTPPAADNAETRRDP
jgi:hypothetical protein